MKVMFECPEWAHAKIKAKAKEKKLTLAEYLVLSALPEVELSKTDEIRRIPQIVNGKEYEKKYVVTKKEFKFKPVEAE